MNPLPVITVTEVQQFRECRRAWYLNNVEHLQPKVPITPMWFGEGIHEALKVYWETRVLVAAHGTFLGWYVKEEIKLKEAYGDLWGEKEEEFLNLCILAEEMLLGYDEFVRAREAEGDVWEPTEIERRVMVPLRSSDGTRSLKDTPCLSARMDLVAKSSGSAVGTGVADFKTVGSKMGMFQGESLDIDEQLTGYGYVFWRVYGEIPSWVAHENLFKKAPKSPKVNKDGSLSVNKSQATTYKLYTSEMTERGISLDDPHYADMLKVLQERGIDDYFVREVTQRNLAQLKNYEERLFYTYQDMRDAADDPRLAYPSPGAMRCPRCPYIKVCHAMEDGGDAAEMIKGNFVVKERDKIGSVILLEAG